MAVLAAVKDGLVVLRMGMNFILVKNVIFFPVKIVPFTLSGQIIHARHFSANGKKIHTFQNGSSPTNAIPYCCVEDLTNMYTGTWYMLVEKLIPEFMPGPTKKLVKVNIWQDMI